VLGNTSRLLSVNPVDRNVARPIDGNPTVVASSTDACQGKAWFADSPCADEHHTSDSVVDNMRQELGRSCGWAASSHEGLPSQSGMG